MDTFYLGLAREIFPKAHIVIDHYHVIAWGVKLLNEIRTSLQVVHRKKFDVKHLLSKPSHKLSPTELSKLQSCFEAFPEVKRA